MFEENNSANDTEQYGLSVKIDRLAKMTSTQRMEKFFTLIQTARTFLVAGIHSRYPQATVEELKKRKAALLLGRDYTIKNYNWDPEIEGY